MPQKKNSRSRLSLAFAVKPRWVQLAPGGETRIGVSGMDAVRCLGIADVRCGEDKAGLDHGGC